MGRHPSRLLEQAPARDFGLADAVGIVGIFEVSQQVPMADAVADFAMNLVIRTHPENGWEQAQKYILSGASPRAAQAIITASRIMAVLNGRYNVSFDDIKAVAKPVLCHRLLLNFEALSDNVSAADLIDKLIAEK